MTSKRGRGGVRRLHQGGNSRESADFFALKAKREGYPARSVYKLQEMDQKIGLIRSGMKLLDVGAAPGSWSLYGLKKVGKKGFLCGVDLKEIKIKQSANSVFLKGDAFSSEILESIRSYGGYDGVICDIAPATTGNRLVDSANSFYLVEKVIDLSAEVVKEGGFLVVKIFQGGDEKLLAQKIAGLYLDYRALKPKACRKDSFESYLIGISLKKQIKEGVI